MKLFQGAKAFFNSMKKLREGSQEMRPKTKRKCNKQHTLLNGNAH